MLVLGVETSCDETGLALYDSERGLLAHKVHSQVELHAVYGGVVPELAARDHVTRIGPLLKSLLAEAEVERTDLDAVAYTAGPGLMGALMVGAGFSQSLAFALGIPALAVHHLEAHVLAAMLDDPSLAAPFLALLVSGGHSQLIGVKELGRYELLGDTLDDAAGEAFDKTATVLGLPYPGGPALAALAETGTAGKFRFSRPMTDRPGLEFSFSGLKTQVLQTAMRSPDLAADRADIARAFEEAVVDTLAIKCKRAIRATGYKHLVAAGGVAANRRLRAELARLADAEGFAVSYPSLALCTDNGAMIAYAGCLRLMQGERSGRDFTTRARWPLAELNPPSAAPLANAGGGI